MTSKYYKYLKTFRKDFNKIYSKNEFVIFLIAAAVVLTFLNSLTLSLQKLSLSRLEIDINGQKRVFEGGVVDDMTVLDAISASALAGSLTFRYAVNPDDNKLTVLSLDGYVSGSSTKPLAVYVNRKKVEVERMHSTPIRAGDGVTIKLE